MPSLRHYVSANRYALLLLLVILAGYCAVLTPYYINVPREDDFPSLYAFAQQYDNGGGIRSILALYSDHRIGLVRLASLLSIWLGGSLNLQWMGYVGIWLILPATGWLLVRFFQRANLPALYLLPVFLLLYQPQYYESVAKVDILFTLIPAAMLTGWAIYTALFARTATGQVVGAAVCCTLATLTFGSGLFGWPIVGLVWLLQRQWLRAAGWYAATGFVVWLYLLGHERSGYMHEVTVDFLRENLGYVVQGWLAFLGAALSSGAQVTGWNVMLGLLVVGTFTWAALRTVQQPARPGPEGQVQRGLTVWLAHTLLIGAVTALGRVYGSDGVWAVMLGRYKFYTAIAIALTYGLLLFQLPRQRRLVLGVGSALAMLFCVWSYRFYLPELDARFNGYVASIVNWKQTGTGLQYWNQAEGDSILRESIRRGEYVYPARLTEALLNQPVASPATSALRVEQQTITRHFGQYTFPEDVFTFQNDTEPTRPHLGDGVYVLLKSPTFTYLLATEPKPYAGRNPLGEGAGYTATMRSTLYRPGTYTLFELRVNKSATELRPIGQTIVVRDIPQTSGQLPPVRPWPIARPNS